MHTKAVLWDMDGTLVDSGDLHFVAWQATLAAEGHPFTMEHHLASFGLRNDAILRRFVDPAITADAIARLGNAKEQHYRDLVAQHGIAVLLGVRDWLAHLHAAGWRQAVASSGPIANINAIIAATELGAFFDALVSGDEVVESKPHPAIFLRAAALLDVSPERCIVVEDALFGVQAGLAAGMAVIGVGPTHATLGTAPHVAGLDELAPTAFDALLAGTAERR